MPEQQRSGIGVGEAKTDPPPSAADLPDCKPSALEPQNSEHAARLVAALRGARNCNASEAAMQPRMSECGGEADMHDNFGGPFVYGVNAKTVPSPYMPPNSVVP